MASEQELKVLLKLQADVAEVQGKLNPALDQTKAKLAAVATEAEVAGAATSAMGEALAGLAEAAIFTGVGALAAAMVAIPTIISHIGEEQRKWNEDVKKSSDDLLAQVQIWDLLAEHAGKFSDVVALSVKGIAELNKLADQVTAANKKTGGGFLDWLTSPSGQSDDETIRIKRVQEALANLTGGLTSYEAEQKKADDKTAEWAADLDKPVAALSKYDQKIADVKERLAQIEPSKSVADAAAFDKAKQELEFLTGRKEKLAKEVKDADQAHLSALDKAALLNARASNDPQLVIEKQVTAEYDRQYALGKAKHQDDETAKADAKTVSEALRAQLENQLSVKGAVGGTADAHRDILTFLTEENALLRQNRQEQQLVEGNSFLFTDQKNSALLILIPQQIAAINAQIAQGQQAIANTVLDPQQLARANAAIGTAQFQVAQLSQKVQTLSFSGQFRASLVSWVNQIGTTATQVANIVTNTHGTAINGVSNAITGAIFRTQTWGQAFAQISQQIIGNLIQIVLQWAVQRAVMAALNIAFGASEATAVSAQAGAAAAAWSPAAVAASIASYGAAAGAGLIAFIGAETSGVAFATGLAAGTGGGGGFAEGGIIPGPPSSRDNRLAFVASGEGIINAAAVQRFGGADFINALNRGTIAVPTFARGGVSGGSEGSSISTDGRKMAFELHVHHDLASGIKKFQQSPAGRKAFLDLAHGNRVELGLT